MHSDRSIVKAHSGEKMNKCNQYNQRPLIKDLSVLGDVHSDLSRRSLFTDTCLAAAKHNTIQYILYNAIQYNTIPAWPQPPASIYQPHPSPIQTNHFPLELWSRIFKSLWKVGCPSLLKSTSSNLAR